MLTQKRDFFGVYYLAIISYIKHGMAAERTGAEPAAAHGGAVAAGAGAAAAWWAVQ